MLPIDDGVEDDAAAVHDDSGVIILVASLEKATEASDMVAITFVGGRRGAGEAARRWHFI